MRVGIAGSAGSAGSGDTAGDGQGGRSKRSVCHVRRLRLVLSVILTILAVILTTGCQVSPLSDSQASQTKSNPPGQSTAKPATPTAQSALPRQAIGSYANMERGFNVISYGNDAYASSETKNALNDLRALGANAVTFTTSYAMTSKTSSTIETSKFTASDSALATGIAWARQLGMRTTVALYVDLADGSWRARIQPTDRDLWFSQYSAILNHLADIAEQNKVDHLCIGVELISMTTATSNPDNTRRWLAMIQGVRERYHGGVIYAANWGGSLGFGDEYSHIQFWNAVDEVGIDAYYPLTPHALPTLTELEHSWGQIHDTILIPFARQVQRPIVFTEVGYRSVEGAAVAPSNIPMDTPYAGCEQAQAYFALLESWKTSKLLAGIQWWYWSTASDALKPQETSYSPRGKPAATVVAAFWGGRTAYTVQALGWLLRQCSTG